MMLTRLWIVAAIVCAMLVRLTIDVAISVIDVVLNCSALSMAIIVMLVRLWVMTVTIIVVFVCPSVDTAIIVMMLIWLDTFNELLSSLFVAVVLIDSALSVAIIVMLDGYSLADVGSGSRYWPVALTRAVN